MDLDYSDSMNERNSIEIITEITTRIRNKKNSPQKPRFGWISGSSGASERSFKQSRTSARIVFMPSDSSVIGGGASLKSVYVQDAVKTVKMISIKNCIYPIPATARLSTGANNCKPV